LIPAFPSFARVVGAGDPRIAGPGQAARDDQARPLLCGGIHDAQTPVALISK
jgi:hypothetical protein